MKASEYNKQFAKERVDHIGQPSTSDITEEVWRRVGSVSSTDRTTQISNKGRYRTVDTYALLNGGKLKPKLLKTDVDIPTRDKYFPLEKERYSEGSSRL